MVEDEREEEEVEKEPIYTYPSVWEIKHDQFIFTVIQLWFHLSGHSPSAPSMKGR